MYLFRSGNAEVGADGREGLVQDVDVIGLGKKSGAVDIGVVNTILLSTGASNLHLEPETDPGHAESHWESKGASMSACTAQVTENIGRNGFLSGLIGAPTEKPDVEGACYMQIIEVTANGCQLKTTIRIRRCKGECSLDVW